ncbi:hypothetical protein AGMMS49965_26230 [Bacteroidia bacterium]|nr:hypothetical protein AGMMS49965_26230 [Bacteroidia bacterium]
METNKFITVLTFTYLHEAAIVRGRLESEGIECNVQDELTAQVVPLSSTASSGGIKLQVKECDLKQAAAILTEAGYLKKEDLQPPKEMVALGKILSKIPIVRHWVA